MVKEYPNDKPSKHATVRLPKDMVNAIEEFLKTDQAKKMGFLHITDVVTDAARQVLKSYGYYSTLKPRFIHFNVYEDHVSIIDNELPEAQKWVDVFFREDRPFCERCEKFDCEHVEFALSLPKVEKTLRDQGWKISPDGKTAKGPT